MNILSDFHAAEEITSHVLDLNLNLTLYRDIPIFSQPDPAISIIHISGT